MGVSIVTDSGSGISPSDAQRAGIDVVPVVVVFGGQRMRDGIDIDRGAFLARLRSNQDVPETEPPSVADFEAAFGKRVSAGSDVVYLAMSAGVSKAYDNASAAAAKFPGRVVVLDSLTAAGGLALMVEYARELVAGGASAADVSAKLSPSALKRAGFFSMPDVTPLGRSGRMPKPLVALGSMLNVSLVLKVDEKGAIGPAGQSRSFEKTCEIMVDSLIRALDRSPNARIAVSHSEAPDIAASLKSQIESKMGGVRSIGVYEAPPTLIAHMGTGAVGVFGIVP